MTISELPPRRARAKPRERAPLDRRNEAICAGIEVLAQRGARGLTHREIARYLGWPLGSTSNYFRRRIEIFNAIAARIMEVDLADLAIVNADLDKPGGVSVDSIVEHMVHLLHHSAAPGQRSRSLARAEILFEAARNKDVRQAVEVQIGIADALFQRVFSQLGARDPEASASLFATMVASAHLGFSVARKPLNTGQLEAIVRSWVAVAIGLPAATARVGEKLTATEAEATAFSR